MWRCAEVAGGGFRRILKDGGGLGRNGWVAEVVAQVRKGVKEWEGCGSRGRSAVVVGGV